MVRKINITAKQWSFFPTLLNEILINCRLNKSLNMAFIRSDREMDMLQK